MVDFSLLVSQVDSAVINLKVAGDLILAGSDNSALLAELEAVKLERDEAKSDLEVAKTDLESAQAQVDTLTTALSVANAAIDLVLPVT